jgi:hypothetical protein
MPAEAIVTPAPGRPRAARWGAQGGGRGRGDAPKRLGTFSLDNVTAGRILGNRLCQSWRGPSVMVVAAQVRCSGWPEGARLLVPVPQVAHGKRGWS